jgi:RNA polymerase sigma-70 factor, ECF subfamily
MSPLPTLERAEWTPPSWDALVREHADRVFRLAYRLSGNRVDAEDLTQETFVRAFQALPNFRPGTFEGWLHRITTNLFLDMVRRRRRTSLLALPDENRLAAPSPGSDQVYLERQLDADIQQALDGLPVAVRAAVVLHDLDQLPYQEIALILGIKAATVRTRIHRGRLLLRATLAHRAPLGRPVEASGARGHPRSAKAPSR